MPAKKPASSAACPCGSAMPLSKCCGPYIRGAAIVPTAEALMRSRYTAYTMSDERYLLDTWHSSTRPEHIELDRGIKWIRLKIVNSEFDHVEFIATYKIEGKASRLHENSRFVYENNKWFYVDGNME